MNQVRIRNQLERIYVLTLNSEVYLDEFRDLYQHQFYKNWLARIIYADFLLIPRNINLKYIIKIYHSYLYNILNFLRFITVKYNEWRDIKFEIIKQIQKKYNLNKIFDPLLKRKLISDLPPFHYYYSSIRKEYNLNPELELKTKKEIIYNIFMQKIQNELLNQYSEIYQTNMKTIYTELFEDIFPFLETIMNIEWKHQIKLDIEFN